MKIIIDSSFWVALFLPQDSNHDIAVKIAKEIDIVNQTVFINNFVIEETLTILTYKGTKNIAAEFLNAMNDIGILYTSSSIDEHIGYFYVTKHKISFADHSIIFDAIKYNLHLITFDKQQEKIWKNEI